MNEGDLGTVITTAMLNEGDVDDDGLPDLYVTMIFEQPMPELFYRTHQVMKAVDGHLPITADGSAG